MVSSMSPSDNNRPATAVSVQLLCKAERPLAAQHLTRLHRNAPVHRNGSHLHARSDAGQTCRAGGSWFPLSFHGFGPLPPLVERKAQAALGGALTSWAGLASGVTRCRHFVPSAAVDPFHATGATRRRQGASSRRTGSAKPGKRAQGMTRPVPTQANPGQLWFASAGQRLCLVVGVGAGVRPPGNTPAPHPARRDMHRQGQALPKACQRGPLAAWATRGMAANGKLPRVRERAPLLLVHLCDSRHFGVSARRAHELTIRSPAHIVPFQPRISDPWLNQFRSCLCET
jgi:hypothetical protein